MKRFGNPAGVHNLRAEWIEGKGIVVRDQDGAEVKVSYGATADNRTCYAHVPNIGFIGGWQWPSPPLPFRNLVGFINQGRTYIASVDLPQIGGRGSRGPRRK